MVHNVAEKERGQDELTKPKEWTTLGEHIEWYNRELDNLSGWTRCQNNKRRSEHIRDSRRISMLEEEMYETDRINTALANVLELYAEQNADLLACMKKVDPTFKKAG